MTPRTATTIGKILIWLNVVGAAWNVGLFLAGSHPFTLTMSILNATVAAYCAWVFFEKIPRMQEEHEEAVRRLREPWPSMYPMWRDAERPDLNEKAATILDALNVPNDARHPLHRR